MATAKKLPSGNWRVLVYSHTSGGKRHYKSFTAPTKAAAELLAAQYQNSEKIDSSGYTIAQAIEEYIKVNDGVLSPSTLRNYKNDSKRLAPLGKIKVEKITSADIQSFVSDLSKKGLSPKTIKNTYGLLRTVLTFCGVEKRFMIHLPPSVKKRKIAPENEQIIALYNNANRNMKIAIMLAAFHSLRRGEVCALKYGDIDGNTLYVHADMVLGFDGWVYKETPKTDASNREIYLTNSELQLIGAGDPNDYIVPIKPTSIGTNFYALCRRVGVEGISFHSLRSYFSSIAVAMNIPDIYTGHLGGWRENSSVLKSHYQRPIASINEGYAHKLNDYFDNMMNQNKKDG